jgi:hypothetical protein
MYWNPVLYTVHVPRISRQSPIGSTVLECKVGHGYARLSVAQGSIRMHSATTPSKSIPAKSHQLKSGLLLVWQGTLLIWQGHFWKAQLPNAL